MLTCLFGFSINKKAPLFSGAFLLIGPFLKISKVPTLAEI